MLLASVSLGKNPRQARVRGTAGRRADVTITTPASQTGTVCVFLGILADPPAGTIPAGAIYVDNSATGNAAGTWLYSGSAWTQLN